MKPPGTGPSAGEGGRRWVADFGPYLTMGMQLAISVVAFFFLGRWLDGLWNTTPWLMVAGLVLGTAGGFISFFRSVVAIGKKEEDVRQRGGREREHQ